MGDKRIHKTVVLKHGNQYLVIGIKNMTKNISANLEGYLGYIDGWELNLVAIPLNSSRLPICHLPVPF